MSYWSIFRSCDYMDEHCDYALPQQREAALAAATGALAEVDRVVVEPSDEGLDIKTVLHTPAWAWVGLVLLAFVRRERHAVITASESAQGTTLHVRGTLDTLAASRLRALHAA